MDCPNEKIVAMMKTELYGNGQKGMVKKVNTMETVQSDVKYDLNKLATSFSALAKSDSNKEAVRKALGKSFVIGCAILGAAGTLVGILHIVGK